MKDILLEWQEDGILEFNKKSKIYSQGTIVSSIKSIEITQSDWQEEWSNDLIKTENRNKIAVKRDLKINVLEVKKEYKNLIKIENIDQLEWIINTLNDKILNKLWSGKYLRRNFFGKCYNTEEFFTELSKKITGRTCYGLFIRDEYLQTNTRALSMSKKIYGRINELLKTNEDIKELFKLKYST